MPKVMVFLRGNVLTLDGDEADVRDAATIVDELVGLVERGHDLAPATEHTVAPALIRAADRVCVLSADHAASVS